MNTRKIKLALMVELLNAPSQSDPLDGVKKVMQQFQSEAGKFTGMFLSSKSPVNNTYESQIAALQFENCTLNLEMVTNTRNCQKYIQNFSIEAHQSAQHRIVE